MAIPVRREMIEGFVLVGGTSSRFGRDKARVLYRGRTLLDHALEAIRSLGLPVAIVGPQAERYRVRADRFVTDERPGFGPAEGLRAALEACAAPWALVLSVDMPLVDGATLRALCAATEAGDRAACFVDPSGLRHPFPGLYRSDLRAAFAGDYPPGSLQRLLDSCAARVLDAAEHAGSFAFLMNVNRPEDLGA